MHFSYKDTKIHCIIFHLILGFRIRNLSYLVAVIFMCWLCCATSSRYSQYHGLYVRMQKCTYHLPWDLRLSQIYLCTILSNVSNLLWRRYDIWQWCHVTKRNLYIWRIQWHFKKEKNIMKEFHVISKNLPISLDNSKAENICG